MQVAGELQRQREAHRARLSRLAAPVPLPVPIYRMAEFNDIKAIPFEPGDIETHWRDMWMWDLIEWREKGDPKLKSILEVVANHFRVSVIDLRSHRRTADVVRARQVAMYLARKLTLKSLPEIARKIGDRDHTTVLHGARKIDRLLPFDRTLAGHVSEIRRKLGC